MVNALSAFTKRLLRLVDVTAMDGRDTSLGEARGCLGVRQRVKRAPRWPVEHGHVGRVRIEGSSLVRPEFSGDHGVGCLPEEEREMITAAERKWGPCTAPRWNVARYLS